MSDAPTVRFTKNAANVFFHLLTQCNLRCRHCYINPQQHGRRRLPHAAILKWLEVLALRAPKANLILLGGEPTLRRDLPQIVDAARLMGYGSITIDTNGYLFHNILERVTPAEVDAFSFSLDGSSAAVNDPIRGQGSFDRCTAGIRDAASRGFHISLIYTVSRMNLADLPRMPELLCALNVEDFFIQVIGLRGKSCTEPGEGIARLQVSRAEWQGHVPPVAHRAAADGICVTYPKVYLDPGEPFACAGTVAENYFVFPNGRVYRCPLCEDHPLHSLRFEGDELKPTDPINETDLFRLDIPEGCVMNKLIQPQNISYFPDGRPENRIACCLLKEELQPHRNRKFRNRLKTA